MGQIEAFLKIGFTRSMLLSSDIEAAKPSMFAPIQVTAVPLAFAADLQAWITPVGSLVIFTLLVLIVVRTHIKVRVCREHSLKHLSSACWSARVLKTGVKACRSCRAPRMLFRYACQCPHSFCECYRAINMPASIPGKGPGVALTEVCARRRCLSITMNSICCGARSTPRCSGLPSPA
jgi:hypothetical protein